MTVSRDLWTISFRRTSPNDDAGGSSDSGRAISDPSVCLATASRKSIADDRRSNLVFCGDDDEAFLKTSIEFSAANFDESFLLSQSLIVCVPLSSATRLVFSGRSRRLAPLLSTVTDWSDSNRRPVSNVLGLFRSD